MGPQNDERKTSSKHIFNIFNTQSQNFGVINYSDCFSSDTALFKAGIFFKRVTLVDITDFDPFTCFSELARFENVNWRGKFAFFADLASFFKFLADGDWGQFVLLDIGQISKEAVFVDKLSVFCKLFLNYAWYGVSECRSVNEPQVRVFDSLNRSRPWCWIKQGQLSKTFTRKNCSLTLFIYFNCQFTLVKDKEWAGMIVLLHEILSLVDFTHFKLF